MIGNVRIHLDEVEGLGSYLELEAVYTDESQRSQEEEKVHKLMDLLEVRSENLLERSYVDYLTPSIHLS